MKTSVFTSGGSQAVRIPKELRINAKRVEIERKGETLVLRPLPDENCWPDGYLESFAAGKLDDSFERPPQGEHREIKF
ncbi:MAG: AbrB/MazE/SpoVT family DNA-binding domain-containing protein [Luteolibacter sp.]